MLARLDFGQENLKTFIPLSPLFRLSTNQWKISIYQTRFIDEVLGEINVRKSSEPDFILARTVRESAVTLIRPLRKLFTQFDKAAIVFLEGKSWLSSCLIDLTSILSKS